MSLATLMSRPCVIVRRSPSATEKNDYGDPLIDETTVETVCEIQQKTRDEPRDAGEVSVDEWLLILPIATDVDTSDRIEVDGSAFEFVGAPWRADTGSAAVHHIEATVRRVGNAEEGS